MASLAVEKLSRLHDRAMASFIVDDVHGQDGDSAAAFRTFKNWCGENGLRGECSLILGLKRDKAGMAYQLHPDYVRDVREAGEQKLFDSYMEIMTHLFLFDFTTGMMRSEGPHEGVWLLNEAVPPEEYVGYFTAITEWAAQLGLKVNGLTIPGCGCPACVEFKKNRRIGPLTSAHLNPGVAQALLSLAEAGRLATPVAGTFIGSERSGMAGVKVLAEWGPHAVYDIPPAVAHDHLARWDNDKQYIDVDAYITSDGSSGRLANLIALNSQTLIYYGHWQGLRPDTGLGFQPFQQVFQRLTRNYADRIEWMRPTAIAAYVHTWRHLQILPSAGVTGRSAERNGFDLQLPFAVTEPISLRVRGSSRVQIRTPSGVLIRPWKAFDGEACAIFDLVPVPGRYEFVP
ncbi:MAG TPA: hypothetical protein VL860_12525 [Planctomycetota bacterium]|nr:hypothetical protein [Planctomycetota bacterium]